MVEQPMTCQDVREVAAELALGILEGGERGAALAHLDRCPTCRAEVHDLAAAADAVLTAAPEAEPPPGFEVGVLERLAAERAGAPPAPVVPLHRHRPRALVLAAAALVLLAGIGLGVTLERSGSSGAGPVEVARAPMVTPEGVTIGEAWRTGGDDALVFVSVPAWAEPTPAVAARSPFTLELALADGGEASQGAIATDVGGTTWVGSTDLAGGDIAAVSLVDADGQVWCTGRFS